MNAKLCAFVEYINCILSPDVDNEYSMDYSVASALTYSAAISPSAAVALDAGTDSQKLQLMKLSFFVDDDCKSGKCVCVWEKLLKCILKNINVESPLCSRI